MREADEATEGSTDTAEGGAEPEEPSESEGDFEGGAEEEGVLDCDECGAPVHVDDDRCDECGSVQMTSTSNILKYGVLGFLGLGLTYVFGVATVNAFPPTDALSILLFFVMLAIALIGPLLLTVSALGYRRRKEVLE